MSLSRSRLLLPLSVAFTEIDFAGAFPYNRGSLFGPSRLNRPVNNRERFDRMSTTITQIACDLNEQVPNRYALVLEISELAKRLLEDSREKQGLDPFTKVSTSSEKVIYQALIMKSSEIDMGDGLIG
jgi:hypothetical protein